MRIEKRSNCSKPTVHTFRSVYCQLYKISRDEAPLQEDHPIQYGNLTENTPSKERVHNTDKSEQKGSRLEWQLVTYKSKGPDKKQQHGGGKDRAMPRIIKNQGQHKIDRNKGKGGQTTIGKGKFNFNRG